MDERILFPYKLILDSRKAPQSSVVRYAFIFLLMAGCSQKEHEGPEEPLISTPQAAGPSPTPLPSNKGLPPQHDRRNESFYNRSIDEVIDSVNASESDQKLRDDASISNELKTGRIPLEINAAVQKWLAFFTGKDRERFQRFLNRGEIYRPMIMAVLKDQGIPPELYFLAMIESGFAIHAKSHAQAVGIWQFIKSTGKRYGLRVNTLVDERRDPVRATIAASLYLRDLNNVFQSWYLAMAAYNAGEGRILQAIMKAKTRDFWEIARRGYLPAETMNYIPKFLAAAIIGHEPEKYGFIIPSHHESLRLSSVFVPSGRSLSSFAEKTGVSLEILKDSNPHLLKGVVPHDDEDYRLWLPYEYAGKFQTKDLADLPKTFQVSPQNESSHADPQRSAPTTKKWYLVRRGDSLEKIAVNHGMHLSQLKQLNRLRSNRIFAGQRLKVHEIDQIVKDAGEDSHEPSETQAKMDLVKYTVKPGDNLIEVAKKFGVTVQDLKKLNKLRHFKIYAGQVLKIEPKG